jgi:hypothetical protein
MLAMYENMTQRQLSKELKISYGQFKHLKYIKGMTIEQIVEHVKDGKHEPYFTKEQIEIAKNNGISVHALYDRRRRGWEKIDAITKTPRNKQKKKPGQVVTGIIKVIRVDRKAGITELEYLGKRFYAK